ncbi:MAG: hypothetical protein HYT21_02415 [Candidatus Nealsonbacteria bacterium]|nr:hypothetical protein [Candidatus Nealsonbacteria bacterium]
MPQKTAQDIVKELKDAFNFEEKAILEAQYDCYANLPGRFNERELEDVRKILDVIMVQTMNHANLIAKLIVDYYGRTEEKI